MRIRSVNVFHETDGRLRIEFWDTDARIKTVRCDSVGLHEAALITDFMRGK